MSKVFLFLVLFVAAGCTRVHTGTVLNLEPKDIKVADARQIRQVVDNAGGKSADELVIEFINRYNAENGTSFTAFVAREPVDVSRARVTIDGILVEVKTQK